MTSLMELNRGVLYADLPLAVLTTMAMGEPQSELWRLFQPAGEHMRSKDRGLAIDILRDLARRPATPSQVRLLAWRWLRDMAIEPDTHDADRVEAVIFEGPAGSDEAPLALYRSGAASMLAGDGNIRDFGEGAVAALAIRTVADAEGAAANFPRLAEKPSGPGPGLRITLATPSGLRSREFGSPPPDSSTLPLLQDAD